MDKVALRSDGEIPLKQWWRRILEVVCVLAFLAGQWGIAHHCCEHESDSGHSSESCALCALAHQPVLAVSVELPAIVAVALGEITTPESPAPPQSPCYFPFGPRAPPCVASL